MCLKLSLALACFIGGLAAQKSTAQDNEQAGSELAAFAQPAAAQHTGSKYFQDMYMAQSKPEEIEFGHVCENPNDWEQRFEKINLENMNRQGKVRWGDKHGGYGEHYWDYNHAGHDHESDGDGEESQTSEVYFADSEESKDHPTVYRNKRNPDDEVEFINDEAKSAIFSGKSQKHGGNYRRAKNVRRKRQPDVDSLVIDEESGLVVDRSSGIRYKLVAID